MQPIPVKIKPRVLLWIVNPFGRSDPGSFVAVGNGVGVLMGVMLRGVRVGGTVVGVWVGVSVGGCDTLMIRL